MGSIKIMLGGYPSIEKTAMIVLWFAKLGASTVHSLAYMFIIW
jgi:hypothetical protein